MMLTLADELRERPAARMAIEAATASLYSASLQVIRNDTFWSMMKELQKILDESK